MKNFFLRLFAFFTQQKDPAIPSHSGVDGTPVPQPSDWVRGKETGIVENIRNTTGSWIAYLSPGKWQRDMISLFETDGCMSFTVIDSVQAQMNFMLKFGLISDANVAWLKSTGYLDANGLMNISPRFTAVMSHPAGRFAGNSYQNVWGSARNDGLVPETVWPSSYAGLGLAPNPAVSGETPDNWDRYYATPPAAVIATGQEFRKRFTIQYEWVNQSGRALADSVLSAALQLAPLHLTSAVCMPWNTTAVIEGCGISTEHATLLTQIDGAGIRHIRDHYEPFDKLFAADYALPYAVRGVVSEVIVPAAPVHFTHQFTTPYKLGDTAIEIELMQNVLKLEGCMPLTVASTGYFGPITATANGKFQAKFGISPTAPNNIGPKTLALYTQALSPK